MIMYIKPTLKKKKDARDMYSYGCQTTRAHTSGSLNKCEWRHMECLSFNRRDMNNSTSKSVGVEGCVCTFELAQLGKLTYANPA